MKSLCIIFLVTLICSRLFGQPPSELLDSTASSATNITPYDFYLLKEEKFAEDTRYNLSGNKLREMYVKMFANDMAFARKCFKDKKFETTIKTLKASEKSKIVNGEFYFLIGVSCYYLNRKRPAMRYLERGYNNLNCEECKEKI